MGLFKKKKDNNKCLDKQEVVNIYIAAAMVKLFKSEQWMILAPDDQLRLKKLLSLLAVNLDVNPIAAYNILIHHPEIWGANDAIYERELDGNIITTYIHNGNSYEVYISPEGKLYFQDDDGIHEIIEEEEGDDDYD